MRDASRAGTRPTMPPAAQVAGVAAAAPLTSNRLTMPSIARHAGLRVDDEADGNGCASVN